MSLVTKPCNKTLSTTDVASSCNKKSTCITTTSVTQPTKSTVQTVTTTTTTVTKTLPCPVQIEYLNSSFHHTIGKTSVDQCFPPTQTDRSFSTVANKAWVDQIFKNAESARVKNNGERWIVFDSDYASQVKRLDPFYTNCAFVYDPTKQDVNHWTVFAHALATPVVVAEEVKTTVDALTSSVENMKITPAVVTPKSTKYEHEYMCSCERHHGVRKAYWFYNRRDSRIICLGRSCAKRFGFDMSILAVLKRSFRKCVECQSVHKARDIDSGLCFSCRCALKRPAHVRGHRACTSCQRMCPRGQCTVCISDSAILQTIRFGLREKLGPNWLSIVTGGSKTMKSKPSKKQTMLPTMTTRSKSKITSTIIPAVLP